MATWLGMPPSTVRHGDNPIATSDLLGGGLDLTHRAYKPTTAVSNGANVSQEPFAVAPLTGVAALMTSPGSQIFERIHVFPQTKSYPFILSTQLVDVEVWNAFRTTAQTVSAVTITGPVGVSITTPYVLPIVFPPFVSKVYTVRIDAAGAPRADNAIQWDFVGLAEPLFTLTGLRLLPFTIPPDWDKGIDDEVAYATDVMIAYDDTEQRMMLRSLPNRALSYSAAALDTRGNGLFASLLWSWQARSYGVPIWMDSSPVTEDAVAGTTVIKVDTTNMGLSIGDTVLVMTDPFLWFASPVHEVDADQLILETPTDKDFFARRSAVIPVVLGRVAASVPLDRPTNASTVSQIKFDLQVVDV